jgi:hypothetical protein
VTITQPTAAAPNVFSVTETTGGSVGITATAALSAGPNVVCGSGGVVCGASLNLQAFAASGITLSQVGPISTNGWITITASDPAATPQSTYTLTVSGGCSLAPGLPVPAQTATGASVSFSLYAPQSAGSCALSVTDSMENSGTENVAIVVPTAALASVAVSASDASPPYFHPNEPYTLSVNLDSTANAEDTIAVSSTGFCHVSSFLVLPVGSSTATVALTAPFTNTDQSCGISATLNGVTKQVTFTLAADKVWNLLSSYTTFQSLVTYSFVALALGGAPSYPLQVNITTTGVCSSTTPSPVTVRPGTGSFNFFLEASQPGLCSVTVQDSWGGSGTTQVQFS